MKRTIVLLFLIFILTNKSSYSQDCNCDYIINPTTSNNQFYKASDFPGIGPGSIICLNKGIYEGSLRFTNLQGSASNPIIIKNCEGQVIIDATNGSYGAISFFRSKYIHLTGSGNKNTDYGIFIKKTFLKPNNKSGRSGVIIGDLSSDFEVDHLEIQKTGFAGIIAKTDPKTSNCNSDETKATFRANFTLKNLNIHHNYIHNTGGEGMYIGSTWGYTRTTSKDKCNGFAHLLENINIHHNRIEQAGWDAIQVSLAHKNTKIHDNEIIGYGHYAAIEGEKNQSFGIALGGGTKALVYNNKVIQLPENTTSIQRGISGIDILTGSKFYNNVIVGSGYAGIWVHLRYVKNEVLPDLKESLGLHFMNNTIVEPSVNNTTGTGIYISTCQPRNQGNTGCRYNFNLRFVNNIIIEPVSSIGKVPTWMKLKDVYIQPVTKELSNSSNTIRTNNLYVGKAPTQEQLDLGTTVLSDIKFVVPINYDYNIQNGSVTIDKGMDLSSFGIKYDLVNTTRPLGNGFDIGAYEFDRSTLDIEKISPKKNNNLLTIYPNPIKDKQLQYSIHSSFNSIYLIEIYTATGQLLYKKYKTHNKEKNTINLKNIVTLTSDSILFLKITMNNIYQLKKIILSK